MTERFIKYIPSEEASWLRINKPNAFLLLSLIAERARRNKNIPDGLEIGDATIGWEDCGLTRKKYRDALENLAKFGYIEILCTHKNYRTCQKRAIKRAIKGTLVNLCSSVIWDINPEMEGHQKGQSRAIAGPFEGHEQECKEIKECKEQQQPQTPSSKQIPFPIEDDSVVVVSFFDCLKNLDLSNDQKQSLMKFSEERVKLAVEFSKKEPPKKGLMALLVWHCQTEPPPVANAKKGDEVIILALQFNEVLLQHGYKKIYAENLVLIEEKKMKLADRQQISLTRTIIEVKNDFDECSKLIDNKSLKLKKG